MYEKEHGRYGRGWNRLFEGGCEVLEWNVSGRGRGRGSRRKIKMRIQHNMS